MKATTTTTYYTALKTVAQSILCHPEWDAQTHRDYLASEGFDLAAPITVARWPLPPSTYPLADFVNAWVAKPERAIARANRIAEACHTA